MSPILSSRYLRWALLIAASLSAIALFLLATASANTTLFAQSYDGRDAVARLSPEPDSRN